MGAGRLGRGDRSRAWGAVDTRKGRAVESRTGAGEARKHRVSDEQRDTHHLPAPSLWPIGFAIGVACILVGLVVSKPALIVGLIVAVIFGFLWVRDVAAPSAAAAPAVLKSSFVRSDSECSSVLCSCVVLSGFLCVGTL